MDIKFKLKSLLLGAGLSLLILLGAGCAHFQTVDPYEPVNRKVYALNDILDVYLLRPVSVAYQRILPKALRQGISNFFDNLDEPANLANNLLLLDIRGSTINVFRFAINSTAGVLGLFDVASRMGLPAAGQSFSMVFAFWIDDQSPYLMLPFMGPSTVYDASSRFVRFELLWDGAVSKRQLIPLYAISKRSGILYYDQIIQDAFDPYVLIRQAYLQNRLNRLNALRIYFARTHDLPPPKLPKTSKPHTAPINGRRPVGPEHFDKQDWIEINGA